MTARKTDMYRLQELVRLHRLGTATRRSAELLKMSPNTEREYRRALVNAGLWDGSADEIPELETLKLAVLKHSPPRVPPQQLSTVQAWRERVQELDAKGCGAQAIYDRLRLEEAEFSGSLGAVKRLVARLHRERGPVAEEVAIPVETASGDVAQVDFGYAGYRIDPSGQLRKAWVFVLVLGHSRHQFSKVVFDQRVETWIALHEEAFRALGGVPRTLVPDNLKAAVIRTAFGTADSQSELNRSYRELARHYGFKVDPTPPRAPQKKGKVESGVKYVKNNALKGRDGEAIEQTNEFLRTWTREVAGMRIHGTTSKRPLELFENEERALLLPLPATRYEPVVWKKATVHQDSHVAFDQRLYSVPWQHIGRSAWIRATPATVAIYYDDERIATHRRTGAGYRSTEEKHFPAERAELRHRSQAYWEQRAERIGEEVGSFIREVFAADEELSQLRTVQSIVTYLERYPASRAQAACRRASTYGSTSYQAIKNILTQALDVLPLPSSPPTEARWADPPRFARTTEEWATVEEVSREYH